MANQVIWLLMMNQGEREREHRGGWVSWFTYETHTHRVDVMGKGALRHGTLHVLLGHFSAHYPSMASSKPSLFALHLIEPHHTQWIYQVKQEKTGSTGKANRHLTAAMFQLRNNCNDLIILGWIWPASNVWAASPFPHRSLKESIFENRGACS